MLIDSHAHLDMPQFDKDRDEVILRAFENGISTIITIGSNLESSEKAAGLAQRYPSVYASVGIHPHDSKDASNKDLENIEHLLKEKGVIALGETGLDFFKDYSPRNIQKDIFSKHLDIAVRNEIPIIIHCRNAYDELLEMLQSYKGKGLKGIIHCFSGDALFLKGCLELGLFISLAGPVTFSNASRLRALAQKIPSDRLFIETDSPYLAPAPFRGKRNEPSYVSYVAQTISELRGTSLQDLSRILQVNMKRLFGIGNEIETGKIAYRIRDSLYLNITNRCTNRCGFCIRFYSDYVQGHHLRQKEEPTIDEILRSIRVEPGISEAVFCGYGEPLLRLDVVLKVAASLKKRGMKVRLNTNGQGNIIHGENILPRLKGLIDSISVSLNACNDSQYNSICNPMYGNNTYEKVKSFVLEAKKVIPEVSVTAVDMPEVDMDEIKRIAHDELGVKFRPRTQDMVG